MLSVTELTREGPYKYLRRKYAQKNDYSCGYYCLKVLVNTIGNGADFGLVKSLNMTTDGVCQNSLIHAVRNKGMSASIYRLLCLEDIKKFIRQNKYIITYHHSDEHWLLIVGVRGSVIEFYDSDDIWYMMDYGYVKEELNGFGIVCGKKK